MESSSCRSVHWWFLFGMCTLGFVASPVEAQSSRRNSRASRASAAAASDTLDLTKMTSEDLAPKGERKAKGSKGSPHSGSGSEHPGLLASPAFKVYFDLNYYHRPGVGKADTSFSNFHNFLLFEILPTPEVQFTFDVTSQRYYELSYQVHPVVQFRLGKIAIPFDDMSPHNLFGGRTNVSKLSIGPAFLPDIWAELGVATKLTLVQTRKLTSDLQLYVTNGMGPGGIDPVTAGAPYPDFSKIQDPDNNRDRAYGARLHADFFNRLGIGFSYYHARWSDDDAPKNMNLSILGADAQLRFWNTEIRAGLATMMVDVISDIMYRGGTYLEVGQKFGNRRQFKLLGRGGKIQLDDRVTAPTDQTLVGGAILYQPNFIQYSLEHSQDIQNSPGKTNTSYSALRVVVAL